MEVLPDSRYVMIFTTYLDESGIHKGSQAVVLAGYAATLDQWISFEGEWKQALKELDVPFFHMTDFANRQPPYCTWDEAQRRTRFARLATIINDHVTCSVCVIIPSLVYAAAMGKLYKVMPGRAYGLAATVLTWNTPNALYDHDSDPWVAYVLENGACREGEITNAMNIAARNRDMREKIRFESVRSEDKRNMVQLQAADILAYLWYRQAVSQSTTTRRIPFSNHLNMVKTKCWHCTQLTETEIRRMNVTITQLMSLIAKDKRVKGNSLI
ncbi:MAG: DUF3800 domain-containing protein [Dehalococcoidia bacterium]|jgi:hypothetical protein